MSNDDPRFARLRELDAFSGCSDEELARVDSLITEARVTAGRAVMTEGKVGLEFMVIVEGEAVVTRSGEELGVLGPGSIVGEMGLIDEKIKPRSATVTAKTDMVVYVMNAGEFTSLLREAASMREKIMLTKSVRNHPAGG